MQIFKLKNKYKNTLLLLLFLGCCSAIAQQNPMYTAIDMSDGLPSNEIYFSFNDTLQNLWVGTDRGLVKYNGSEMKIFTLSDGLPGDVVIDYYTDPKGRLWFNTYKNGLFYFQGDSVVIPPFNKLLSNLGGYTSPIHTLHVDEEDNIFFNIQTARYFIFQTHITSDSINYFPLPKSEFTRLYEVNINNAHSIVGISLSIHRDSTKLELQKSDTVKHHFNSVNKLHIPDSIWKDFKKSYGKFTDGENSYYFFQNKLYLKKDTLIKIHDFQNSILNISKYKNYLLISTFESGLHLAEVKDDKLIIDKSFFANFSVSDVNILPNDELLISTLKNGLLFVPDLNSYYYIIPDEIYYNNFKTNIKVDKDRVTLIYDAKIQTLKIADGILKEENIYIPPEENFLKLYGNVGWDGNYIYSKEYKWNYINNEDSLSKVSRSSSIDNAEFLGFNDYDSSFNFIHSGFKILKNDSILFSSESVGFRSKPTVVHKLDSKTYLAGGYSGLFRLNSQGYEYAGDTYKALATRIYDIIEDNRGNIIISTQGSGVVIITSSDTLNLTTQDGLLSNYCTMLLEFENSIIIGTQKGVNELVIEDNKVRVKTLAINNHPFVNQVNNIFRVGDSLVVLSDNKLIFTTLNTNVSNTAPLRLVKFIVDGESVINRNEYIFDKYRRNFSFYFRTYSVFTDQTQKIYYRLNSTDDEWNVSENGIINLYNLGSGNYNLEARYLNNDGFWSESTVVNFRILPPIYFRWWFILISILTALLLIFAITYSVYRRAETKRKLLSYNIKALSLQINPHFIFNALNSVQFFIATNQKREANLFLAKISSLIRGVLVNADKGKVPLDEELLRLTEYIELEKMRLNDEFDYEITVEDDIDTKRIMIMPLLIQPVVENAIWHGLSNLDYKGFLKITIFKKEGNICILISDNGKGISAQAISELQNNTNSRSIGLKNVKSRMELMAESENKDYKILVENVKTDLKESIGTNICLIIPL